MTTHSRSRTDVGSDDDDQPLSLLIPARTGPIALRQPTPDCPCTYGSRLAGTGRTHQARPTAVRGTPPSVRPGVEELSRPTLPPVWRWRLRRSTCPDCRQPSEKYAIEPRPNTGLRIAIAGLDPRLRSLLRRIQDLARRFESSSGLREASGAAQAFSAAGLIVSTRPHDHCPPPGSQCVEATATTGRRVVPGSPCHPASVTIPRTDVAR